MVLLSLAPHAFAQDDGGVSASLRYNLTVRDSSDDGTFARNSLGFSLTSVTRAERFEFELGGTYDFGLSSGIDSELEGANARLLYQRESRSTLLEFSGSFSLSDIEDSVDQDEDEDIGVVVEDGQREDYSLATRLEWGRDAPIGGVVSLGYSERRYIDTTSASLLDTDTLRASFRVNFEVDERITAFTRIGYRDIDRIGGVSSELLSFSVGTDLDITQTLTGEFQLGFSRSTETGVGADPDRDGASASATLVQTLQNGDLRGTFSTDIGENGRTTTLRVTRELELRDGSLTAGVGYGRRAGEDRALFTLGYSRTNPRGSVSLRFNQAFSSSSTGSAVLNSSLRFNFRQELTTRTGYNLAMTFRDSDALDIASSDTQQLTVNFTVDHTLNERWSLVSGYTHSRRKTDGGSTTSDDEIFVGLSSVFSWRP